MAAATGRGSDVKMGAGYYIATPYGDLEQPCWRLVESEVGGDKAIIFALRLRGLAAAANRGGLVCLHDGTPMTPEQICGVLGYTFQVVQRSLEILDKHHLVAAATEGGGIRLLDPLLTQHLLALEAPKRPKTGAERAREYRQRHKTVTPTVTPTVTKSRDVVRDGAVTQQLQDADISGEYPRHETSQNSTYSIEGYKTTTTTPTPVAAVDKNDLLQKAKLLLSAWPHAAAAVDAVAAALANHSPEFVNAQIEYSRANSKTNPSAYLQAALQGDYAGFYAAESVKAAAAAEKHAKATKEAARQAKEDAKLPPVTARECFSIIEQLETAT